MTNEIAQMYDMGTSKPMQRLLDMVDRVAPTNITILITGENGVEKETIARAVHSRSRRKHQPFSYMHCGAIHRELDRGGGHGHERDFLTSVPTAQVNLFKQATGGTLFLDEIHEMTAKAQARILRVLEEQESGRLGGDENSRVDVRIIAASNKDLNQAIRNGSFSEDLYHRINRFRLHVPPLRERWEDIPLLAGQFLQEFSAEHNLTVTDISPDAMNRLRSAHWAENDRQLRYVIEGAVIQTATGTIQMRHLPPRIRDDFPSVQHASEHDLTVGKVGMTMDEIEKEAIRKTLADTGGNKTRAAKILKMGLRTLHRKVQTYGLEDWQDEV